MFHQFLVWVFCFKSSVSASGLVCLQMWPEMVKQSAVGIGYVIEMVKDMQSGGSVQDMSRLDLFLMESVPKLRRQILERELN